MWGVTVTAAPSGKVVNTSDLQKQCEIAVSDGSHDDILDALCVAAVDLFEQTTNCHLLSRTSDYTVDQPPSHDCDAMYLPHYPVTAIGDLQYIDENGSSQTYTGSNLVKSLTKKPAALSLTDGSSWPVVAEQRDTLTIKNVVTGYGTAADIPQGIKQSIMMLVAHWFENRESSVIGTITANTPMATEVIWEAYKIHAGYFKLQRS